MLGLDQNQAIQAIEEMLVKLKSGEAKLFRFDFTTEATGIEQFSVFGSGPQSVQRQRPRFKIEMEVEMGFAPEPQPPLTGEDWGVEVVDDEFTVGEDGLPATDEYAWSTSADVQARAMKVVKYGAAKPKADYARMMLGPRRREFTAPVEAPKPKKQPFGSRDLDID